MCKLVVMTSILNLIPKFIYLNASSSNDPVLNLGKYLFILGEQY